MTIRLNTNLILDYIAEHKISKTKFCELCEISLSTLNKLLRDDLSVRAIVILKIASVLHVRTDDLICRE